MLAGASYDRDHDPSGTARQLAAIIASGNRTPELHTIGAPTLGDTAAVQLAQNSAQRNAQAVMHSMTEMGVPATRMATSSSTDPAIAASEVRVYVR